MIQTLLIIGLCVGTLLTIIIFALLYSFSKIKDPEDEFDIEIQEYKFWKNKVNTKKKD